MLSHRQNNVLKATSGATTEPQFAASYTVTVFPVGAVASAASSGGTLTVDAGHSFAALDKMLIWDGTTGTYSGSNTVSSTTATTIVMSAGSYSVSIGDLIVNLGPDTGTSSPTYNNSKTPIYSDMDGGTAETNSRVTTDATGNYAYWHRGDGRIWELIRDASGTVAGVVPGWGGVAGRFNIADYGAVGDDSTDDTGAIQAVINAAEATGVANEVFAPGLTFRYTSLTFSANGLALIGESASSTIFKCTSETATAMLFENTRHRLENFQATSTAARTAVISTAYADPIANANVNGKNGIVFAPSDDTTTQFQCSIRNVLIDGHPDDGLLAEQPEFLLAENVVCTNNGRFGIHLNGQANTRGVSNSLINCRGQSSGSYNIYLRSMRHDTLINPQALQGSGTIQLYLHGGRGHTVINPDVEDTAYNANEGIRLVGNLHKIIGGFTFLIETPISLVSATECSVIRPENSGDSGNNSAAVVTVDANSHDNYIELSQASDYTNTTASYSINSSAVGSRVHADEDFVSLDDTGTPTAVGGRYFLTGGTTAITSITAGFKSQRITILAAHSVTMTDGGNLVLAGNFAMTSGDSMELIYDGTNWRELSRSDNA